MKQESGGGEPREGLDVGGPRNLKYKFKKIAGTSLLTYWKKIEEPIYIKKQYDKISNNK